jgi:dTDP-4-dehydrorhamnose reductase
MGCVLVTGAAGMLGGQVLRAAPEGEAAVGADRAEGDLADPKVVRRLLTVHDPLRGVIHCAGFTDVDGAEDDEDQAARDNALATRELAAACARAQLPLVVVSTDYVFDGELDRPYREDDEPNPRSAYGRTKLAAERAARAVWPQGTRIVRTSWLYGPGGRHFPGRILELARAGDELRVVEDQRGSPTSTLALAPVLWELLDAPAGIYHATCSGACSWFELAQATLGLAGVTGVRVVPCTTAEFPRPAPRPRNSVLNGAKLAALRGKPMPAWRDALARYLEGHK